MDGFLQDMARVLANPKLREMNQKAIHGKVYYMIPEMEKCMDELRAHEDNIQQMVFERVSKLWNRYSKHGIEVMLINKGILRSDQGAEPADSPRKKEHFALACLDGKDRLMCIMDKYDWRGEFFRWYPIHEYENSFGFVSRERPEPEPLNVHVIGLGVGGSFAASGLAKAGCKVTGYEKRNYKEATSRYQTASWNLYTSADELLDEEAYNELKEYRQAMHFKHKDGGKSIFKMNRCTTILGGTVGIGINSAKRFGADIKFETNYMECEKEKPDLVALYAGAHTSKVFGIEEEMGMLTWDSVNSDCHIWVEMTESEHTTPYTAKKAEVGAEKWDYIITSARDNTGDIDRTAGNLQRLHKKKLATLPEGPERDAAIAKFDKYMAHLDEIKGAVEEGSTARYDYVFGSAPVNDYNQVKIDNLARKGDVVVDGVYVVQPTLAQQTAWTKGDLLKKFNAEHVIVGGDGVVAPNPMAARGATCACDNAQSLVQLATGLGHLNVMLRDMKYHDVDAEWVKELEELKELLPLYFDAVSCSENFFQWTQTVICNLFSIPPTEKWTNGGLSGQIAAGAAIADDGDLW